jgi:uncharacterized protein YbjT (DUF2867 family)
MILITGATGFVGSHLLEKLRARGEAVRCLVRPATDTRRLPAGTETARPISPPEKASIARSTEWTP